MPVPVQTETVRTGAGMPAQVTFQRIREGQNGVLVTVQDSQGREQRASQRIHVTVSTRDPTEKDEKKQMTPEEIAEHQRSVPITSSQHGDDNDRRSNKFCDGVFVPLFLFQSG